MVLSCFDTFALLIPVVISGFDQVFQVFAIVGKEWNQTAGPGGGVLL